jgi:hypothetical protein
MGPDLGDVADCADRGPNAVIRQNLADSKSYTSRHDPATLHRFKSPTFADLFTNSKWERLPRSLANIWRQNDKRREFLRGV